MAGNQKIDTKDWLTSLFNEYIDNLNGHADHPHVRFRKSGYQQLNQLDFPTRKDEDWKYTSVTPIMYPNYKIGLGVELSETVFNSLKINGLDAYHVVFVNGVLNNTFSNLDSIPEGVALTTMSAYLESHDDQWIQSLRSLPGGTEKNTFLPMNQAFAQDGMVMTIRKNFTLDKPIHFMYISLEQGQAFFAHPQLYVHADEGSNVTFLEDFQAADRELVYFNNVANYIEVKKNAHVKQYRIQHESRKGFQVNNTLVSQAKDSTYSSFVADLGGDIVRNNLSTELQGSNTMTNYYGVYLADGGQHMDNQTFIDHAMPHCDSNEHYKGILADNATGVFNGKVLVRQDAQKTNAFQQNSSLVLDDTASMDAKPQLEIYADDVKCSHGATIGQLDESSIFYLKTRGIPEKDARNLLQKAFLGEVIMEMKIEEVRDYILSLIDAKLS